MVSIKFTGAGLQSRGTKFDPDHNGGVYDVEKEDADYLLDTFPSWFILLSREVETKPETKKRAPRKKKVVKEETPKEETPKDGEETK